MTPEEKKMQEYFASIKDPEQRKKEVSKWLISQRANLRKKAEAREEKLKAKYVINCFTKA